MSNQASIAFAAVGSGLAIIALRVVKRWVFWMLLLTAIPCLLIAAGIYWFTTHGISGEIGAGLVRKKFESSLRVGMSESDVWETVEKHYPPKHASIRPTVLQNGTDGVGIFVPGEGGAVEKEIYLRFADGKVVEVREK